MPVQEVVRRFTTLSRLWHAEFHKDEGTWEECGIGCCVADRQAIQRAAS